MSFYYAIFKLPNGSPRKYTFAAPSNTHALSTLMSFAEVKLTKDFEEYELYRVMENGKDYTSVSHKYKDAIGKESVKNITPERPPKKEEIKAILSETEWAMYEVEADK